MNQFSPLVEQIIKNYTSELLFKLIEELKHNSGDPGVLFSCQVNYEYVIKRFIGGCLARDSQIKFNSYMGLSIVAKQTIIGINEDALVKYIIEISNHKKHCGGKKIEMESYLIGKLLIFKGLQHFLKNNLEVLANLSAVIKEFTNLEENILDVASLITHDKKSRLAFSKIQVDTKSGFVMHKIILSRLKKIELDLNQNVVDQVIEEAMNEFPRRSLCIQYLGAELKNFIQSPAQYFTKKIGPYFLEEEELDLKKIYYLLQLMKIHLKDLVITPQNIDKMLSIEMLKAWLDQMRVKNKTMKDLIVNLSITFQQSSEFAFSVLERFHKDKLYLQNINENHPLSQLYHLVNAQEYWKFIYQLCIKELNELDIQEEGKENHIAELQYLITLRFDQLSTEIMGKSITLLIKRYHKAKSQSNLNSISGLLNFIFITKKKKKIIVNTKAGTILSKIDFNDLELQQHSQVIKETIKYTRLKIKQHKDQLDPFKIVFYNFLLAVNYYALIFPEEVEVCQQLQLVEQDLRINFFQDEVKDKLKKKRKKSQNDEDEKKPIHVLIDIFVSLLTKSPQFLRSNINLLFQHLIPYLEGSDLSQILEVIQRPDQEYIEQI